MSKEIIIDGVDVSGCEDLSRFKDGCCCGKQYEEFASCEGYDCAYKQLKRLQKENEELKKEISIYRNSIIANHDRAIGKRLEEVLEENERLNSTCLQLQSSELKQNLEKVNCERENYKLRKALEEIREMCNNTCEYNKDCIHSCYECKSIDESVAINRILNKVNEVLK